MTHKHILKLGAAAAVLAAGAAGAAFAHPHAEGDGDGKKTERIVIIRDVAEHQAKGKGERVRRFEIIRPGEHHARAAGHRIRRFDMRGHGALVDCLDGEKVVDESSGDGDKKTKVILCTRGKPIAATAQGLEAALARINSNDELSDEQKARITTALRSAIDRARGAR